MKFLFFTDSHIRGTTPKNRKDNFYETLKTKLLEITNISKSWMWTIYYMAGTGLTDRIFLHL